MHWALAVAGTILPTASDAQTSGMERRGDRRDNREDARDEKQECKAGDDEPAQEEKPQAPPEA